MSDAQGFSRRDFMKSTAGAAVALSSFAGIGTQARAEGQTIKVGLVGCGGRGTHDLKKCMEAGEHLGLKMEVVSVADFFKEKATKLGEAYGLDEGKCHDGFEGYKRVMKSGADVVILATSPNFRPIHFEAAIKADKHVFMEKPIAVDPPGARKVIEVGEMAKEKKLSVVAGTQRRHQSNYRSTQYAIAQGVIGKIMGGCVYWCGGKLWKVDRGPDMTDAEYLVRNWVSFAEMSGDHIVEQHVHNLDIANWFLGRTPQTAIGFGGRARRQTGNQFDFFSVDFDYGENCHIHSMCRQVDGTYSRVSEWFVGTEGSTWGSGKPESNAPKTIEIPEFPEFGGGDGQEFVDLLDSIVKKEPLNEARNVSEATLTAIMGRIAAYTGEIIKWSDVAEANGTYGNLVLTPTAEDFEKGEVKAPADNVVPIPGKA